MHQNAGRAKSGASCDPPTKELDQADRRDSLARYTFVASDLMTLVARMTASPGDGNGMTAELMRWRSGDPRAEVEMTAECSSEDGAKGWSSRIRYLIGATGVCSGSSEAT